MPSYCAVIKCNSNAARDSGIRFFRIPSILGKNRQKCEISQKRQAAWINAIKRKNWSSNLTKYGRVCSRHFHSGKPAALEDENNPDWVPSLLMGHECLRVDKRPSDLEREHRSGKRKKVQKEQSPVEYIEIESEHEEETDTALSNQTDETVRDIEIKEEKQTMDKGKVYKIIPVEFIGIEDDAYLLKSTDGEEYNLSGGNIPTKKGSLIRLDNKTFLKLINNIVLDDDVEEILIVNDNETVKQEQEEHDFNSSPSKEKNSAIWPNESTRILIDMYRKLRPLVFKAEIKSMRQMWEQIAQNLKEHGYNYETHQVESKWKSLVRSYRVGLVLGIKRKSHYLSQPFEKDIGEILKMMNLMQNGKSLDTSGFSLSPPPTKISKMNTSELEPEVENVKVNNEEILSRQIFKLNTEEINSNLSRIVKAIEVGTYKRERAEQKKHEQRERLIQAVEKGNELLSKLLQKK